MKRFWMALLAFLGLAAIAAAITIPTYLVPKLKVVPLDLDITSDASTVSGEGQTGERFPAVIFDRCSVSAAKAGQLGANLSQQRRSLIIEPSDAKQATLQSAQTVLIERVRDADGKETVPTVAAAGDERKCNDGLLTASIDRVSVNRVSSAPNGVISSLQMEQQGEGVPLEDVSVHLEDRKGFQYKFGFDVQQKDYYYYDLNTRQDTVASFVGEKTIDGLKTYHFRTEVPETDISELPNPEGDAPLGTILNMPAKWWGISGRGVKATDMVEMHRYAAAVRNVYVEPVTGTIVDGYEEQHQYFRSPVADDSDTPKPVADFRMDALKANFKWSDATVSAQVARAEKYVGLLRWGGTIVPIILGVLGVLLLGLWALLLLRGRHAEPAVAGIDDAEQAPLIWDEPSAAAPGTDLPEPGYAGSAPTEPVYIEPAYIEPTAAEPSHAQPVYPAPEYPPVEAVSADQYWAPEVPPAAPAPEPAPFAEPAPGAPASPMAPPPMTPPPTVQVPATPVPAPTAPAPPAVDRPLTSAPSAPGSGGEDLDTIVFAPLSGLPASELHDPSVTLPATEVVDATATGGPAPESAVPETPAQRASIDDFVPLDNPIAAIPVDPEPTEQHGRHERPE